MSTKIIYQILIHRFLELPTSQGKYEEEFGIQENEWSEIYMLPFKCCHDVKTQN